MRRRLNRGSRNSLFLMELIMAIFFFVIACGVCVQVFTKAHLISGDTRSTRLAVEEAENAAEIFRAHPQDTVSALLARLDGASLENGAVTACYDKDGKACDRDDAATVLKVVPGSSGATATAAIAVTDAGGTEIYALQVEKHIALQAGGQ
jgi:hypothetical protein